MGRSLFGILIGIFLVIIFTILSGIIYIPLSIAMWLFPLGFFLGCLIIGVVGRLRVLHLLLISFLVYLGLMSFLTINAFLWSAMQFGPLVFNQILLAWTAFQTTVNLLVPFLGILSNVASTIRESLGGSMMGVFLEFTVASSLIGFIGLLITGISGYLTRFPPLYVLTAPEPAVDVPEPAITATPPSMSESSLVPPVEQTASLPPMEAPPQSQAIPPPRAVEEPVPTPKEGSPSAKAISSLKGKVTKHLKGTGQKAPAGQSRCPHCNATIIRGSRFCNSCEREI